MFSRHMFTKYNALSATLNRLMLMNKGENSKTLSMFKNKMPSTYQTVSMLFIFYCLVCCSQCNPLQNSQANISTTLQKKSES